MKLAQECATQIRGVGPWELRGEHLPSRTCAIPPAAPATKSLTTRRESPAFSMSSNASDSILQAYVLGYAEGRSEEFGLYLEMQLIGKCRNRSANWPKAPTSAGKRGSPPGAERAGSQSAPPICGAAEPSLPCLTLPSGNLSQRQLGNARQQHQSSGVSHHAPGSFKGTLSRIILYVFLTSGPAFAPRRSPSFPGPPLALVQNLRNIPQFGLGR